MTDFLLIKDGKPIKKLAEVQVYVHHGDRVMGSITGTLGGYGPDVTPGAEKGDGFVTVLHSTNNIAVAAARVGPTSENPQLTVVRAEDWVPPMVWRLNVECNINKTDWSKTYETRPRFSRVISDICHLCGLTQDPADGTFGFIRDLGFTNRTTDLAGTVTAVFEGNVQHYGFTVREVAVYE